MSAVEGSLPLFTDPRGSLLPIEFDELPFAPVRIFLVTGPEEGARRGGHLVPCRELLVLITGSATVTNAGRTTRLDRPGQWVLLEHGKMVDYVLDPGSSTVAVLADEPYVALDEPGSGG